MSATFVQADSGDLAVEYVTHCFLCKSEGTPLHAALRDWVFGAPGVWQMLECRGCGLAWLSPRLAKDSIGVAYATYYTHSTQERGTIFRSVVPFAGVVERWRERIAKWFSEVAERIRANRLGYPAVAASAGVSAASRLAERIPVLRDNALLAVADLPPGAGRRVLDVGCGSGEFLLRMRDRGWEVVGVEPDPVAAARARDAHLDVRDGLLTEAAFPDDTFDAIVLSHVIEHVHDPMAILGECGRVLRPGGLVILMTPNLESIGHRRFGADWRGLEPPRHLHLFSCRSLSACVQRSGLSVTAVRTSARWTRGIWWVSCVNQHRAGNRRQAPGIGSYLESWGMSLVEDVRRAADPHSSEEIILAATKPSLHHPPR